MIYYIITLKVAIFKKKNHATHAGGRVHIELRHVHVVLMHFIYFSTSIPVDRVLNLQFILLYLILSHLPSIKLENSICLPSL